MSSFKKASDVVDAQAWGIDKTDSANASIVLVMDNGQIRVLDNQIRDQFDDDFDDDVGDEFADAVDAAAADFDAAGVSYPPVVPNLQPIKAESLGPKDNAYIQNTVLSQLVECYIHLGYGSAATGRQRLSNVYQIAIAFEQRFGTQGGNVWPLSSLVNLVFGGVKGVKRVTSKDKGKTFEGHFKSFKNQNYARQMVAVVESSATGEAVSEGINAKFKRGTGVIQRAKRAVGGDVPASSRAVIRFFTQPALSTSPAFKVAKNAFIQVALALGLMWQKQAEKSVEALQLIASSSGTPGE